MRPGGDDRPQDLADGERGGERADMTERVRWRRHEMRLLHPGHGRHHERAADGETGGEGVKLEQQVLIAEDGVELLSEFPFEDDLLA